MKFIRYGKYVGEPADAIDLEELVRRLGDFFLQSGFESQFYGVSQMDPERSMEALREAILRALQQGDLLPEDAMSDELREMLRDPAAMNSQAVKDLLDKLTERLANEGFINPQQPPQVTPPPHTSARGQLGQPQDRQTEARFEITDKTIDFLGFKTLQDLLGSLGRSSFGRHDTRDLSTGVESGGVSRPYEFGDTLNMDISATLFNAVRRDQRILLRQKKDMRQIVMITDGKPSALTLEDGRIYKNAFGLDPFVVSQTLEEVNKCKRAGIMINTFMLASDYSLVHFVQKITEMCRGKAYFTTPYTLGQYLLMDYMSRKTRQIH